jgi:protein ImuB
MKRILCLRIENPAAQASNALQTVATRCKQFTPLVGIDPDVFPHSALLDITNVIHLFDGEAALVQRIVDELKAEGWQLRAAVADTPGAAWALAFPASRPLSSLSALPLEALRLPEPIVSLLHGLGIWQIEQLEALPRYELSSRFGPELLNCLDRVRGRLPEPLPAWDPPPQFEVHWSAEFPTAGREMIEAALEQLIRRLAAMLVKAGRGAMRLECLLKCTVGESQQVTVGLFRPTALANHLVQLLEVQFESLQLPGPVDAIHLAATSTAPLELRQHELFSEGRRRIQPHYLSGLIDRLSNRLGPSCVMQVQLIPDAQPELACRYTPLVSDRATTPRIRQMVNLPRGCRPLRLLTQPLRLPGGIDGPFSFGGRPQRIMRRLGPERIETGWWRGRCVARDYYRIETTTGRCYWVFRRLPEGPWFLHGIFD